MVRLNTHRSFANNEITKFNKIITNVGGGYIDDDNNAEYGKFIAPCNGTYQFSATFSNGDTYIGADLCMNNGGLIIAANNGGVGAASLSAILDLQESDQVYLRKPLWVDNEAAYNHYFTSFSGILVRVAV